MATDLTLTELTALPEPALLDQLRDWYSAHLTGTEAPGDIDAYAHATLQFLRSHSLA